MTVCFLDFDGCLVVNGVFSQAAVKNLNDLLAKEPDLKIVISSSWRIMAYNFAGTCLNTKALMRTRL